MIWPFLFYVCLVFITMFQKIRERAINEKMRETFFWVILTNIDLNNVCLRGEMASNFGFNDARKLPKTVLESSTKSNGSLISYTNARKLIFSVKKQPKMI